MAQLVARLVRNEKVGGSNPPSSTTGRHPMRMSVFYMPGVVLRACCCGALSPLVLRAPDRLPVGLAAVCAGGRRPAREIATREPEGSEWSISKPALALPPPTSTAARPSGPSGALHTGGACSVCRLNVWPGPAGLAAASNRSRCLYVARPGPAAPTGTAARPSGRSGTLHTCGPGRWRVLGASTRCPAALLSLAVTHVKPSTPLLACALSPVKPTTPLQARYTHFWCYFIAQRRRGFLTGVLRFPHWC